MALATSNTFHIPAVTDSIARSRGYWNSSFKAVLQNFASANAVPISTNLNYENTLTSPPEGMLYYNQTTGALYINTTKYGSGPYGSFRRLGLGTRSYSNITAAVSSAGSLDPGELIVVINDTAGVANNRVYLVSDTSKTLVDVGTPYSASVGTEQLANSSVTDDKLDSSLVYLSLVL